MRLVGIFIVVLAVAALSGCSSDGAGKSSGSKATASTNAPKPTKTYVPASGDPKTHVLHVTIRDVASVDAYKQGENGKCVSNAPEAFPHQLVVSGPDAENESVDFKSFDIPKIAQMNMGACESEMTVTVPYAPRYAMAITGEGQGIAIPDAPEPSWIATRGSSQSVTLVSQVVTTLR